MDLGAALRAKGFNVRTDHRARFYREDPCPAVVVVKRNDLKWADLLQEAVSADPRADLVIDFDGNGIALTDGFSGVVVVRTMDDLATDERQDQVIDAARLLLNGEAQPEVVEEPSPAEEPETP